MGFFGGPDINGMKKRQDLDALINCLKDKSSDVRILACGALGELQNSRAVEPLINALKDKHGGVRHAAVFALGSIKDPRAVKPLIETYYGKGEYSLLSGGYTKSDVFESLEKIRSTEAIQAIVDFYMKGEQDLFSLRKVITNIGDPALKILDQAKKSKSETIHPLLISHIKKILGNKPVDAIGFAHYRRRNTVGGAVSSTVDSLSTTVMNYAVFGGFGKAFAPNDSEIILLAISVNKENLSIISLEKMYLGNLYIDPVLTFLSSNTVKPNSIQTYPLKELTITYDDKNYIFSSTGDFDRLLVIPEFNDYLNLLNAPKIAKVVGHV